MTFIYSKYAADEDWRDLLEDFVTDLPDRLRALEAAIASGDLDTLSFLVHQLKGACGSYGYDGITPLAYQLERAIEANPSMVSWEHQLNTFREAIRQITAQPAPAGNRLPDHLTKDEGQTMCAEVSEKSKAYLKT